MVDMDQIVVARSARRHHLYAVLRERGILGDEFETFDQCLRDEHAVERVAMMQRQRTGDLGVSRS